MQILQQFLGEQGLRYAFYALTFFAFLIVVLIIWFLIRKALGDRLNFSDKPDRRGRAPRLGITESFTVDREGRRLVMVRRDNVEHLVMIGGPNDVVIETNVLRGERPVVARNESRSAEPELIPNLALQVVEPVPMPPVASPAPVAPRSEMQPGINLPNPNPSRTSPAQRPVDASELPSPSRAFEAKAPEIRAPETKSLAQPPAPPKPVVPEKPVSVEKTRELDRPIAVNASVDVSPAQTITAEQPAAKSTMSFAERMKSRLSFGGQDKAASPAVDKEPAPKAFEPAPLPPPVPVTAKAQNELEVRSRIESVLRGKEPVIAAPVKPTPMMPAPVRPAPAASPVQPAPPPSQIAVPLSAPPVPPASVRVSEPSKTPVPQPAVPTPPVPASAPPPLAPSVPVPAAIVQAVTAPAAAPPPKQVSKNPFDSLEEEMAKLLGRTPEGKG